MKTYVSHAFAALSATLLAACAPYPPGDCRYDATCRDYPNDQNFHRKDELRGGGHVPYGYDDVRVNYPERVRADFIDEYGDRYYLASDGYYYRDPAYRGVRYSYVDGYYVVDRPSLRIPPGGYQKPNTMPTRKN